MRASMEEIEISKEYFDNETGEAIQLKHTHRIHSQYFTIKKLNSKVSIMGIAEAQERICSSKQDIYIFWKIVDALDKYNVFRENVTTWSKSIGVNQRKVREILTRSVEADFLRNYERGIYTANPFVIKGKAVSNETAEKLQKDWSTSWFKELNDVVKNE